MEHRSSSDAVANRGGVPTSSAPRRFSASSRQCFSPDTLHLIATSAHKDVGHYHCEVSRRIEELEEEIRALRTSHNSVTVTCRLPTDTLSEIFLHTRGDSPAYRCGGFTGLARCQRGWLKITHVCQHWRDVALNFAPLWAYLDFSMPKFIGTMLGRSKQSPLTVRLMNHREKLPADTLKETLSQSERLRVVDISSHGDQGVFSAMAPFWPINAPSLEELALWDKRAALELPTGALLERTKSLRILALRYSHLS